MSEANLFFNDMIENTKSGMYVARLGKIIKFYPETQSADVMPMPSKDNAAVLNAPVCTVRSSDFLIYYPLKPGDMVVILFCDNDTEDIKLGGDTAQTERTHDVSDAVILGGFTLLSDSADVKDKEALCIQNKSKSASIVVKKDGEVTIDAKDIKLKGFATYNDREIAVVGDSTSDGATIIK
jgi:hypothetical protein